MSSDHCPRLEDDPRRSAETYDLLGARYPRHFRAHNNAGAMYMGWLGDSVRAFAAYQRAAVISPGNPTALGNLLGTAWRFGRLDLADSILSVMPERGLEEQAARHSRAGHQGQALQH